MPIRDPDSLALLRQQIARIERHSGSQDDRPQLSTGFETIDAHLNGGLRRGSVHEVFGAGSDRPVAVKPSRFVASILSGSSGQIVWITSTALDLHLAGLVQSGLSPGRLIIVQARPDSMLGLCEDVLREPGVGAMVADLDMPLTLTASRRLQLAAEYGNGIGFLLHRETGRSTPSASACATRWRIRGAASSVVPFGASTGTGTIPLGPEHWTIDLLRQRAGRAASWTFEAPCHAPHAFALAPVLAHRSMAAPASHLSLVSPGAACA